MFNVTPLQATANTSAASTFTTKLTVRPTVIFFANQYRVFPWLQSHISSTCITIEEVDEFARRPHRHDTLLSIIFPLFHILSLTLPFSSHLIRINPPLRYAPLGSSFVH